MNCEARYDIRSIWYIDEFKFFEDIPLISSFLKNDDNVLDIPCGAGRLIPQFVKSNVRFTGADVEEKMIRQYEMRIRNLDTSDRHIGHTCIADMRDMSNLGVYDKIIVSRHGLQLLPSYSDVSLALSAMSKHLRSGGVLYLDVCKIAEHFSNRSVQKYLDFSSGAVLKGKDQIDIKDGVMIRKFISKISDGKANVTFWYRVNVSEERVIRFVAHNSWLIIDTDWLLNELSRDDLCPIEEFGDYSGNPFRQNSERLILEARKK